MKNHGWEVNAVFNKKFSSFALYKGRESENLLPYQVSSKFRPRELDNKFIEGLRKWFVNFQLDEGILKFKSLSLSNDFIPHLYVLSLWSQYHLLLLLCWSYIVFGMVLIKKKKIVWHGDQPLLVYFRLFFDWQLIGTLLFLWTSLSWKGAKKSYLHLPSWYG